MYLLFRNDTSYHLSYTIIKISRGLIDTQHTEIVNQCLRTNTRARAPHIFNIPVNRFPPNSPLSPYCYEEYKSATKFIRHKRLDSHNQCKTKGNPQTRRKQTIAKTKKKSFSNSNHPVHAIYFQFVLSTGCRKGNTNTPRPIKVFGLTF